MPDTYSLVDTTEKLVEEQVVDKSLLVSQRNINSRPASIDPWDENAPLRDEMRNEDEPCYWSDINLQDVGLGFEADERISFGENIKGQFDKREFLNKFHKAINDVITHMISEVAEGPKGSWHSKQLHEKKAILSPKTTDINSVARWNSIDLYQTQEMDKLIC